MGPQFMALENQEQTSKINSVPFISYRENDFPKINFQHTVDTPKYFEDANIHWGVKLDLQATCPRFFFEKKF